MLPSFSAPSTSLESVSFSVVRCASPRVDCRATGGVVTSHTDEWRIPFPCGGTGYIGFDYSAFTRPVRLSSALVIGCIQDIRGTRTNLDNFHSRRGIVTCMYDQVWVLVLGEERENGVPCTTTDFNNFLWTSLREVIEPVNSVKMRGARTEETYVGFCTI